MDEVALGMCSEELVFRERGEWGEAGWDYCQKSIRRVFFSLGVLDFGYFPCL